MATTFPSLLSDAENPWVRITGQVEAEGVASYPDAWLAAWLDGLGLTARRALALGLGGPPGPSAERLELAAAAEWVSLKGDLAEARKQLAWAEERAATIGELRDPDAGRWREEAREFVLECRAGLAGAEAAAAADERENGPAPQHWHSLAGE